jgi:hypothetical protein
MHRIPPVEEEEITRKETLHAAAVSMAKQMYSLIPRVEENLFAADSNRRMAQSDESRMIRPRPAVEEPAGMLQRPASLHEAAQKLAAERLAKIRDEERASQDRYDAAFHPKHHPLISPRRRQRSSSNGDAMDVRGAQSRMTRSEILTFPSKSTQAGAEKRSKDREVLMAAARRNADITLRSIDQMIYSHKGKPTSAKIREWEDRASKLPQADREIQGARLSPANGEKGEKGMDKGRIHVLARSRVQPTLDALTDRADEKRAQGIESRLDEEKKSRQIELMKEREIDTKTEHKRLKSAIDSIVCPY